MSPTKPMSPTADTTAAVPRDEATTTMNRTRLTGRPRLRDSTSPTANTSRARALIKATMSATATYGITRHTVDHDAWARDPRSQM